MTARLRLGVSCSDTWHFFQPIYEVMRKEFDTVLFQERPEPSYLVSSRLQNWSFRRRLRRFLNQVDVAYFEWAGGHLLAATRLPKTCKIITRLHQYELFHYGDQIRWENVDRIIFVGSGIQRAFIAKYPAFADRTILIAGGISLERFRPEDRPLQKTIGTLCHIDPRKRVYELILLFQALIRSGLDLRLILGGDERPRFGDYHVANHRLVKQLGLESRVEFTGPVPEPPAWYPKLDIYVSNSYSEGLQVAPMEAIASGCYCLSHHWDGAEDYLSADTLYLTETDFVGKVQKYYAASDQERVAWQSEQCARIQDHCDIRQVAERICDTIRSLSTMKAESNQSTLLKVRT